MNSCCAPAASMRACDPTAVPNQIAVEFRELYLFDDTIEANFRVARPNAMVHDLVHAARASSSDRLSNRSRTAGPPVSVKVEPGSPAESAKRPAAQAVPDGL